MLDGCLDWQERGLAPPEAVTAATADYLEAQDAIGAWLEERCEHEANEWTARSLLFESWKNCATQAGEYVGTSKAFYEALEGRGLEQKRQPGTGVRGFRGIGLKEFSTEGLYWNR